MFTVRYYDHETTSKTITQAFRDLDELIATYGQGNQPGTVTETATGEKIERPRTDPSPG